MADTLAVLAAKIANLERLVRDLSRSSRLANSSIENGSIVVYDDAGALRGSIGLQEDGTVAMAAVNGPPPPQPTAPVVVSILGGLAVSWPGTFADALVVPLDWSRLEIHASTADGFEPVSATLRGTLESPQGGTLTIPTDESLYVRLVARNTSGTASAPSDQTGPLGPAPVVAQAVLDNIITTAALADDAVTSAKVAVAAIDSQALAEAAVNAEKIGTAAVTAGKLAAQSVTVNALTAALADTASQRYVDAMGDPTAWIVTATGTGASTWSHLSGVADTPTGQSVGQAVGFVRVRGANPIPYDPETLYRISARVRATAQPTTADVFYCGILGLGADATTLVNRDGANLPTSHTYVAASAKPLATSDGWVTVTGYLKGRAAAGTSGSAGTNSDPRSPGVVHANVRFVAPYLWLNYNNQTAVAGTMQVDAVTIEALKTGLVDSTNFVAGSVTTAALATDAVTADKIAAGSVAAAEIAAGAVTTAKLAAGAVTANEIAANTVTAGNLAASSVTAAALAAGSVQTAALAADAVAAGKISAGAVTAREIAALAITADKIAANSITAGKLAAGSVTAASLAADAINGKTITGVTVTGGTVTGGIVETAAAGQRIKLVPTTDFDVIDVHGGTIHPPGIEFYSGDTVEQNPGYLVSYSGDEFGGTVTELSTPDVGHSTASLQLIGGDSYGRVATFTGVAGGAATWLDPTTWVARLADGTQLAVGYKFGSNADGVYASLCNISTATKPVHFALGGAVIYAPGGTVAKWQPVASFGTGWATGPVSGSYQSIRYRRDAQDNVHIQGTMHTTAASAASTAWTLATGYRPATAQRIPVAISTSSTITAGIATVATTGAVTITPTPAASADVYVNGFLPLGNIS
ncbi:hypothetical protein [Streptomyces sp. NPDC051677]|uniref:hypothetical protein n=1 Tax=Streptomyces sp. NPDC051677 TaxID=3365669 RepID=UPI0037D7CC5C